jgi:plasmid stabilization system protein ParE
MSQHRLSDAARVDLEESRLYIAQDNKPEASDRFIRVTASGFSTLESMPCMEHSTAKSYPHFCEAFR